MKTRTLISAFLTFAFLNIINARNADEIQPLLIGSKAPKVSLIDESGVKRYLPALLKGKRTVLVFYRGGWCPYCNKHLQALGAAESKLLELGYQIIAISPDAPKSLGRIEEDGELNYSLYSDSSLEAASAFGIDFTMSKAALLKYKAYGISLEKSSGGLNKNKLPVPSVFLITPNNEISFVHVDPEARFRLSTKLLLAAAEDALAFHEN